MLIDFDARPSVKLDVPKSHQQLHLAFQSRTIFYYTIGLAAFLFLSILDILLIFLEQNSDPIEKFFFLIFGLIFLTCTVIDVVLIYREYKRKELQHQ